MNIIKNHLLDNQYYQQNTNKTQIVLHHTASGPNVQNVINGWNLTPNKIGTAYIIGIDGKIYEYF